MSSTRAVTVALDGVTPCQVEWLWRYRLARGKLNFLVGDPGLGKSFVTLDIAARITKGACWPDSPDEAPAPAGEVLLLNAEDALNDTVVPRLIAAGADLSKIHAITAISPEGKGNRQVNLGTDLSVLEERIAEQPDITLVIIDPASAFYGATIDTNKDSHVRAVLAPLADLADRRNLCVLLVAHLNKNGTGPAVYRTSGSLAFVAAARMVWAVAKDKEDPARRLLLPVKHNVAKIVSGLGYRIVPSTIDPEMGVIEWEIGGVETSADEALNERPEKSPKTAEAAEWLRKLLADGPVAGPDVKQAAIDNGISWWTIFAAKDRAGVKIRKGGWTGRWLWSL